MELCFHSNISITINTLKILVTRKLKAHKWHTKYLSPTYTKYLQLGDFSCYF